MSGGADSTALLLGLHRLAPELRIELAAAHLHHGLRGRDADADLEFVRGLCERLGVPLRAARWNARLRMRREGTSGQDGLRLLRRRFLVDAARRMEAQAIATAHTADDQLETLLMRLARGTGLAGLSGIAPRRGAWIRPLLEASRADVIADLLASGERWREDRSNADPSYERNRVRHEVVPALLGERRAVDGARGTLARRVAAALREVREARRLLEPRASRALVDVSPGRAGERTLEVEPLAALPDLLLRMALRKAWSSLSPPSGLTAPMLDGLAALVRDSRPGPLSLPGGWSARRERGTIRIGPSRSGIEHGAPTGRSRRLRIPGPNQFRGLELQASWVEGPRARRKLLQNCKGEWFAAGNLEGTLELRLGRTDEWFIPFGGLRPRRLGHFLKKTGIPGPCRSDRVVLADQQGILWVVGVRRSARAPLTPGTRKALWVRART